MLLPTLASVDWLSVSALAGVIAAVATAFVTFLKLSPEKNAIYISTAQGAAVIQTNLIETLQAEIERERENSKELQAQIDKLKAENERLEVANDTLAARHGTRSTDEEVRANEAD